VRLIISLILATLMVSCATPPARSQSSYTVVATCGTPPATFLAGAVRTGTMDTSGQICSVAPAGAGSATAANQVLQLAQETAINTVLGLQADSACATDNGTCTIAALTKRNNQRLTTLNTTLGTPMQATGGTVTAAAAENHIGEVGGNLLPITSAMTTSNATVTTGQSIGGLQTLTNAVRVSGALGASGTSGLIQSAMLTFTDAVTGTSADIYYFNANPTGSTCTNTNAFALVNADRDKVIGVVHMTDFTASNTTVIGQSHNQAMPFGVASATSIYACVVARASFAITSTANASLVTRILRN
jgi:hypothetical protein